MKQLRNCLHHYRSIKSAHRERKNNTTLPVSNVNKPFTTFLTLGGTGQAADCPGVASEKGLFSQGRPGSWNNLGAPIPAALCCCLMPGRRRGGQIMGCQAQDQLHSFIRPTNIPQIPTCVGHCAVCRGCEGQGKPVPALRELQPSWTSGSRDWNSRIIHYFR